MPQKAAPALGPSQDSPNRAGLFPLGFAECQVWAVAQTCIDLADIASAKQGAGLGAGSHIRVLHFPGARQKTPPGQSVSMSP